MEKSPDTLFRFGSYIHKKIILSFVITVFGLQIKLPHLYEVQILK